MIKTGDFVKDKRIAIGFGVRMRGILVRRYAHLPPASAAALLAPHARVDGRMLSTMFRRNMTEMGITEPPRRRRP